MSKETYEQAVAKRNDEYRQIVKATPTSSLIRMFVEEIIDASGRELQNWQERIVEAELDERIPARKT